MPGTGKLVGHQSKKYCTAMCQVEAKKLRCWQRTRNLTKSWWWRYKNSGYMYAKKREKVRPSRKIRILIWLIKVPFFWSHRWALLAKVTVFGPQKRHFEWPNQNSKTTFIVQTFPKYGPYDFYFVNLSLLGAILAIFQFCWFSGLFWPFFPCKIGKTLGQNLPIYSWPNFVFEVMGQFYTLRVAKSKF